MLLNIVIITFLIIGAFVQWLHYLALQEIKRQLRTLAEAACPACSSKFGDAAAGRARKEHLQHCENVRKQNPALRINFARKWNVVCPACGASAEFSYESLELKAKAA